MNSTEEDFHYRFKVVVIGAPKVGKTTFLDSNFYTYLLFSFN